MSENPITLNKHNYRLIEQDEFNLLFQVPSSSLFEIENEDKLIIKDLENEVIKFTSSLDNETLESLQKFNIIGNEEEVKAKEVKNFPATTLILNIVSGCNLSCTYCYKADLTTLKNSGNMTFETASAAIDQLYNGAPNQKNYTVTFFGGEPLSSFELIKEVTLYAVEYFRDKDANVDFTITTNGTLLTKSIISFLSIYKFGVTISIDGPKAIHDKRRLTNNGKGTYDVVTTKAKMLLANYTDRPIGARVTLTAGVTEVEEILTHLYDDLKFSEVGFAPATASDNAIFNLSEKELIEVFNGFKRLGNRYVEYALKGEFNGFSNLHRLIGDIHAGRKKSLPCGAGVGLLSVDYSGKFDLCHRFTGSSFPSFGDVKVGLDKPKLSNFIEKRLNHKDPQCSKCHIRNLCAGGCYHESFMRYNDPSKAVLHYCDIMRDWIDFGLSAYSKIRSNNPEFFDIYFKTNQGDTNGLI